MTHDPSADQQIQELLRSVLELHRSDRAAYLEETCAEDSSLRRQLETLVEEAEGSGPPADLAHTTATEQPGDHIGRYKLLESIGEGGFGSVYMAEQTEPVTRRVALKIVKPGMDSREVIARFEAERQALALMDDPNIAKIFDAGTTVTGRPYFVMELVNGIPITQFCNDQRLDTRQRLDLFIDVCSAVQHAHQKGVIHRDLKPSNILVTLHGDRPVPKVIDFGIAKATQQKLTDKTLFTRFSQFIGTPVYMSPEQAVHSGLDIDTRSDIYSLGVLLYELLTGKPPFDAESLMSAGYDEMRRIIREQEPPLPSSRLSTLAGKERATVARDHHADAGSLGRLVRGDLDWIVMKSIEKDRARRYETANALALDLRRHLDDEPVRAAAPTLPYRMQKFVRRNRTGVVVAGTITLLLVVGVAVSSTFAVLAHRANQREAGLRIDLEDQLGETQSARDAEAHERKRAQATLQQLQLEQAQAHVHAGEPARALAFLARVLRDHPDNHLAATRLLDLLVRHDLPRPAGPPVQGQDPVGATAFSPDGLQFAAASGKTARIYQSRTGLPVGKPLEHQDRVMHAHFSPDGQRLLTVASDQSATLWDLRSGQLLAPPLLHEHTITDARFSPDGSRVVTASEDKTARLWDAFTGERLADTLVHGDWVTSARFSPDGRRLVTACRDQHARVWDAFSGQLLAAPIRIGSSLSHAEFSPDQKRILTLGYDNAVRLWDATTGAPLGSPMQHGARVLTASFSPDGTRILTASFDNQARLWNGHSGQPLGDPMPHRDGVWFADFSPDGQRVVTASHDKTARLWSAWTGSPMGGPMLHHDKVDLARFSPDGQTVLTAAGEQAHLWDVRLHPREEPMQHDMRVRYAEFSPDGDRVVTASYDKSARIWNAETAQLLGTPLAHRGFVEDARFSPDGKHLLTASVDHLARRWDVQTGQLLGEPIRNDRSAMTLVRYSPDGTRFATVSSFGVAALWDSKTGSSLGLSMGHKSHIRDLAFSPDGAFVATASADHTARLWDAQSGQPKGRLMEHEDAVDSIAFSPDGEQLVTASEDGTVQVWSVPECFKIGEPIRHDGYPFSLALFSPDGERILTVSADHTARLWDATTHQPVGTPMRHSALIISAQFSHGDHARIVTSSFDRTARLWDADSGQALGEPLWHSAWVTCASFDPEGERVVTGGLDNRARIWHTPSVPVPVPAWVADWAEAAGGRRLTPELQLVSVTFKERTRVQKEISTRAGTDLFSTAASWFFADPSTRSLSPWSNISVSDYVQRRIAENTTASLREAVLVAPTDGTAFALLALTTLAEAGENDEARVQEALLYGRLAVTWSPARAGSWEALARAHHACGNHKEGLEAVERALALQADRPGLRELKQALLDGP